jgi:hypothetical protein
LAQAYAELRKKAEELGINLEEIGISEKYTEESANKLVAVLEE